MKVKQWIKRRIVVLINKTSNNQKQKKTEIQKQTSFKDKNLW